MITTHVSVRFDSLKELERKSRELPVYPHPVRCSFQGNWKTRFKTSSPEPRAASEWSP